MRIFRDNLTPSFIPTPDALLLAFNCSYILCFDRIIIFASILNALQIRPTSTTRTYEIDMYDVYLLCAPCDVQSL
jgi:hypothetical protein